MNLELDGYIIVCDTSANILSHDWGTEFYHEKGDADIRAVELENVCPESKFSVIPATIKSSHYLS